MSTDPKPDHPKPDPVLSELAAYESEGRIVPGAAAALAGIWSGALRKAPAEVIAGEIRRKLDLPEIARRYGNPGYQPPASLTPLEHELRRRTDARTAATLAREWAAQLTGREPPALAREVVRRLAARAHEQRMAAPAPEVDPEAPPPPPDPNRRSLVR